jgi:hypothetical protein
LRQGRGKGWHYERVWEICKRQGFDTKVVRDDTIFIGKYAISYIKLKVLIIHELDDEYKILRRVTLYDVFGFYQCSFVKVVSSLVGLGLATKDEVERMRQNKARRADFNSPKWPLDRIKAYTVEELRKLSTAATVLRKAAFEDGIRMS